MIEKLFNFFIPEKYRANPEDYRQAKICTLFYLLNAIGLVLNSYSGITYDYLPFLYLNLIYAAISVGMAFMIRAGVSFKICATILATIGFFYVNNIIINMGGIQSVTVFGLMFVPIYYLFLSNDLRSSVIWMVLTLLCVVGIYLYELHVAELPICINQDSIDEFHVAVIFAQIATIFLLISIFQIQKNHAVNELMKINDDLKNTQAQLIQSEKLASLGELTAGIAHEIQNPLNFVNNFSEVSEELLLELQEEKDKNSEDRDAELESEILNDLKGNLEKISHHGKRASSIVKSMLEHSRMSDGKKELTNLNVLADEYLRLSFHGIRAKDKSFNSEMLTNFDQNIPQINVVSQDIGRVMLNLINNAFQAVDEKSKKGIEGFRPSIAVSTKADDKHVYFIIKDNGLGIPPEIENKIFHPFFTTKETGKGTGLGLSLSNEIVKSHGGELKMTTQIGEGSEFMIALPLN